MTCDTSIRDHKRVIALKKEFKSVFTMSIGCDDNICDQVHHLKHKMNRNGASALIEHLNEQNPTVKFDFICLEYVRMPSAYYRAFVMGTNVKTPGTPLLNFLRRLRKGDKLNSGCKLLLASIGQDDVSHCWSQTKQLLEKEFGEVRDVEAKENPYYMACAKPGCCEPYDHIYELKNHNSNEKPFAEVTVAPVRKDNALSLPFKLTNPLSEDDDEESDSALTNPLSEDDDEESDSALNTILRDLGSKDGDEESDSALNTILRDLGSKDGDEESDSALNTMLRDLLSKYGDEESHFDSQTSTEDTPVAPSTENFRYNLQSPTLHTPVAPSTENFTSNLQSAPQSKELIQKVAERIANGERYRTACEALGFNLNENKEYKGGYTPDYSRLQYQVRKKVKDKQKKLLVEQNERLVEELRKVTFHLQYVTEQYCVLQEKLNKCECGSSRKRKITHLQPKKKQSRNMIHNTNY